MVIAVQRNIAAMEILSNITGAVRRDWEAEEARALISAPLTDLVHAAQIIHREHFDPHEIQISTLINIKTGGCPEDCSYCSQSVHHKTNLKAEKLMSVESVRAAALRARDAGATRFCMGAAWRAPNERDISAVCDMIGAVKKLGMETCATLGMLNTDQTLELKKAGLDYYNHNIDTSSTYYDKIITTRTFEDRLKTLSRVRAAGINVCCGGILGMGESRNDRADMLQILATLPQHPESVPLNMLVPIEGTPLENITPLDPLELVRAIATARILMPQSMVRLSAGRLEMETPTQTLCFLAGANSIFFGDTLLTTGNPEQSADNALLQKLGVRPMPFE